MSALGKNGVDPFVFPYDPHPEFRDVFLAHLSKRIIGREASLECRGRLKQDPRESGANKA